MRHAPNWNGDDRTLCGDALEADAKIDHAAPEVVAVGQLVDCPNCRRVIRHVYERFAGLYILRRPYDHR